jgi:hypothetical protein
VRALDPPASLDKNGRLDTERAKGMEAGTGSDDVCNRIRRTDLVKSDFLDRNAVDFSLRHGNTLKHRYRPGLHLRVQCRFFQQFTDLPPRSAMDMDAVAVIMPMGAM